MSIERFTFSGFHGRPAACGLERIDLADGRVVVIAIELPDNPGVSVTNFAELLATMVCHRFGINPVKLVWIEHYPPDPCPICNGAGRQRGDRLCGGCRGSGRRRERGTYDLVTFATVARGHSLMFDDPKWRPMQEADWKAIGLEPRD